METPIHHISDTAFWIAGYRAQESDRPDAVFKDPLAKKLAGTSGRFMVAQTPNTRLMAFAMVARTTGIDRLIYEAINRGVDMVINLGAGFDTRPYRMQLPEQLKWIEVDFSHLIDHKNSRLADDKPVCQLQRIAVDLSVRRERKELFAQLSSQTQKALVVTEGLIGYLTNTQAEELSKDIFSIPSFKFWITDFAQGRFRKNGQAKKLKKILINTPQQFTDADPINFFRAQGWKVAEKIFILDEGDRIGRKIPGMFPWNVLSKVFPKTIRKLGNQTYGYVMFGKDD